MAEILVVYQNFNQKSNYGRIWGHISAFDMQAAKWCTHHKFELMRLPEREKKKGS